MHTCKHVNSDTHVDVAIVGAGIAGIATAYYLTAASKPVSVLLIDSRAPMSYTSAQSGDNYRNWWPHPTMTAFTNDSVDELERLARDCDDVFQMRRGGYVLATRRNDISSILDDEQPGVAIDVITGRKLLSEKYPALSDAINTVLHVRRGGHLSGQQLGQFMLERFRDAGGKRRSAAVVGVNKGRRYTIEHAAADGRHNVTADVLINAAGPFVNDIAAMLDVELPVRNVYQQKIAFEDRLAAIPRDMPFSIDLDSKQLAWSAEEKTLLEEDEKHAWLAATMPGGTHCRPEGGARGKWVKLGWAYNRKSSEPLDDLASEPASDPQFPEIVIRGAAAFIPALAPYIETPPARYTHYGGYYTMTEENWPLVGPLDGNGAYVVGALSGFGTMSACAAGKLCAAYVTGAALPTYAGDLSLQRYANDERMRELAAAANKGLL